MKANDFLKLIAANIGVEIPVDVLAKLDDELPETFDTKFSGTYLTRERAKSDDEIITEITKKSNKTALTAVDDQIKEFLPILSDEWRQKINSVFSTLEKTKFLKQAIDETLTKTKSKAADEDVRKVDAEWAAKNKAIADEFKQKEALLVKQMEEKNFDFMVTSKLSAFNIAEPFKATREQINAMAIMALKQKGYKYELENGVVAVRQDKDGIIRDAYDGDKKVTFESLIDSYMQPFIAKSNGNGTGSENQQQEVKKLMHIEAGDDLRTRMMKEQNNMNYVQV